MRSQVTHSQGIWIYQHQSCGIFVIVNCQLRIPQIFQSLLMTSSNRCGGILVSWWNLSIETISRENLNYFTKLMPLVLGVALAIIDTLNTETDPPVEPDRDWKRIRFYPNRWGAAYHWEWLDSFKLATFMADDFCRFPAAPLWSFLFSEYQYANWIRHNLTFNKQELSTTKNVS